MPAQIGRAVSPRFLRDAADRYSDVIGDDAARVTREAVDVVQARLALIKLEWNGCETGAF